MSLTRVAALAACLLVLVACQDATAPRGEPGSPELRAAQGDRSEWTLMLSYYYAGSDFYYPCADGGQGEDLTYTGTIYWYTKDVVTPSGNVIQTQRIDWGDDSRMVGHESGDVWTLVKLVQPMVVRITKQTDGLRVAENVMNEWWVNQDGDRMNSRASAEIVFDENWYILEYTRLNWVCKFIPGH